MQYEQPSDNPSACALLRSGQIRVSTSIKPRMPKRELDVPLDATLPCLVKSQLAHWRRKHEPG